MQIAVTHLTRMRHPYICVAGIDKKRDHRRPVLVSATGQHKQLGRDLLSGNGGPFELGRVVDLGKVAPRPVVPEKEDVVFDPARAKFVKLLEEDRFLQLLEGCAEGSLGSIFGQDLEHLSGTAAAVPEGKGEVSLGVLKPSEARLEISWEWDKEIIRFGFVDPDFGEIKLKVTDIRLWESDYKTPATKAINSIKGRLEGCLAAVGLGRPYEVSSYPGPRHYLQVNNIYPRGDPLWARE